MPCLPWGATACCDAGRPPMEVTMLQRGEIVVERLTGNRAMVIRVVGPEEVTCRFADGRLEDRFAFELEPLLSPLGSLRSVLPLSGLTPAQNPQLRLGR